MRGHTAWAAVITIVTVACGGGVEDVSTSEAALDAPYGYRARLTWCTKLAACDGIDTTVCAKPIDDAPTMQLGHYERCASLVEQLACNAPRDTGAWVHTKFACGH
jgi:hypothetical protein